MEERKEVRKEGERKSKMRKEIKWSLFVKGIIFYVGDYENSTKKLLE
jgi:hypothetical protein